LLERAVGGAQTLGDARVRAPRTSPRTWRSGVGPALPAFAQLADETTTCTRSAARSNPGTASASSRCTAASRSAVSPGAPAVASRRPPAATARAARAPQCRRRAACRNPFAQRARRPAPPRWPRAARRRRAASRSRARRPRRAPPRAAPPPRTACLARSCAAAARSRSAQSTDRPLVLPFALDHADVAAGDRASQPPALRAGGGPGRPAPFDLVELGLKRRSISSRRPRRGAETPLRLLVPARRRRGGGLGTTRWRRSARTPCAPPRSAALARRRSAREAQAVLDQGGEARRGGVG
jgi:hypothetical protein